MKHDKTATWGCVESIHLTMIFFNVKEIGKSHMVRCYPIQVQCGVLEDVSELRQSAGLSLLSQLKMSCS